jgi:hypothetical protein
MTEMASNSSVGRRVCQWVGWTLVVLSIVAFLVSAGMWLFVISLAKQNPAGFRNSADGWAFLVFGFLALCAAFIGFGIGLIAIFFVPVNGRRFAIALGVSLALNFLAGPTPSLYITLHSRSQKPPHVPAVLGGARTSSPDQRRISVTKSPIDRPIRAAPLS